MSWRSNQWLFMNWWSMIMGPFNTHEKQRAPQTWELVTDTVWREKFTLTKWSGKTHKKTIKQCLNKQRSCMRSINNDLVGRWWVKAHALLCWSLDEKRSAATYLFHWTPEGLWLTRGCRETQLCDIFIVKIKLMNFSFVMDLWNLQFCDSQL